MLTDSLRSIIEKMSFYFRKHSYMADKSVPRNHLMNTDLRITETVVYLHTYSSDNHLISVGLVELNCNTIVKF